MKCHCNNFKLRRLEKHNGGLMTVCSNCGRLPPDKWSKKSLGLNRVANSLDLLSINIFNLPKKDVLKKLEEIKCLVTDKQV